MPRDAPPAGRRVGIAEKSPRELDPVPDRLEQVADRSEADRLRGISRTVRSGIEGIGPFPMWLLRLSPSSL